jgi:cell division protein FtsL
VEEQTSNKNEDKHASGEKSKKSLSHILGGGILVDNFVVKRIKFLVMIGVLFLSFIANRYVCQKKIVEIEDLKKQLTNVKYEYLDISTKLITNSRQSQIEDLLKKRGLNLSGTKTPPFELKK